MSAKARRRGMGDSPRPDDAEVPGDAEEGDGAVHASPGPPDAACADEAAAAAAEAQQLARALVGAISRPGVAAATV